MDLGENKISNIEEIANLEAPFLELLRISTNSIISRYELYSQI